MVAFQLRSVDMDFLRADGSPAVGAVKEHESIPGAFVDSEGVRVYPKSIIAGVHFRIDALFVELKAIKELVSEPVVVDEPMAPTPKKAPAKKK
jgi:hypothetical protein